MDGTIGRGGAERDEATAARGSDFWSESGGALAVIALFVVLGLGGAALAGGAYPPGAMADEGEIGRGEAGVAGEGAGESVDPRLWLVDGFNVLHAVVLKGRDRKEWWRGPKRARVLDLAGALPDADAEIVVVFDGEEPDEAPELPPRVRQVFAPSADDWVVRRVKDAPAGAPVTVVTADRALADRARHHGAEIVSPRRFAERCRTGDEAGAEERGGQGAGAEERRG